jgi:NAD(P)H-dependent FMN reductase
LNIGIVVYSLSGHTASVAMDLKEKLAASGHPVTLERVEFEGPAKVSAEHGASKTRPAVDPYDVVVFACPVRGGAPPPPMASYLEQIPSLHNKRVAFLVTHFFPRAWGANQTIALMKGVCESKGATVCGSGTVRWFGCSRKRQIAQVVGDLIHCLDRSTARPRR